MSEAETDLQRSSRIQAIVSDCIRLRVAGGGPTDQQLLTEHAELQPELGERLRKLALIEAADRRVAGLSDGTDAHRAAGLPPQDSFPGYEIREEVRRGGQGVVYRALQKSTQRTVAIKVMHEGPFAGPADQARFEREVQILGRFNHPSIVAIHDSGVAAGGAFFVMDYIEGAPLDAYMVQRDRSVEETLRLFAGICDAVSAAHLRGVIHRDLKPGNIRVDAAGEPHVLDFGLARVVDDSAAHQSFTVTGQFVGSLPWASPEQAEGARDQIDMRTDVYSLGAILYQMLTSRFPFSVTGSVHDVVARILNDDPIRPRTLRRQIDDEVETIVLKCLAKERERRYQTAGELSRDIRHYLAGEPIEAKRDSAGYVLGKHLRRHKLPLAIGVAFVVIVTIGFITSLTFWRSAADQRDAAETARTAESEQRTVAEANVQRAELEAAKARAVVDFLTHDVLAAADPRATPNRELTVKEALDNAAESIEGRFRDEPLVEASIRATLGRTYMQLGAYDLAEEHLVATLGLRRAGLDREHPQVLGSVGDLAELYRLQSRYEEAEPLLTDALGVSRRVLGDRHPDTLQRINDLALLYRDLGRYPDAERLMTEALAGLRSLKGPENVDTLAAMTNLAKVYRSQGKWSESEELYQGVLGTTRRMLGDDHPLTLAALTSMAVLYSNQSRPVEAEPLLSEAVERYSRTLGEQHSYTLRAMHQLANTYRDLHRFDEAEQLLGETLALQRAALGEDHVDTSATLSTLGLTLLDTRRYAAAEPLLVEALERKRRVLGVEHPETLIAMHHLGYLRRAQGRYAEAEALFAELLPARRRLLGDSHPHTIAALGFLCATRARLGRYAEAEPVARELVKQLRNQSPPANPMMIARSLHLLADILMNLDDAQGAEPLLRESLELRHAALPADDPSIAITQGMLGECLATLGRYEEAEPLLLESYKHLAPQAEKPSAEARKTNDRLVALYEAWGRPEQAAEWRSRAGESP